MSASVASAAPLERVLVFSETAAFRHDSIPAGITAIQEIGAANGFAVDATEDSTAFTDANLAQYQAVVWLSTTGDVLTDEQQGAFERFIAAGNGYVGIHAAADTEYGWDWYGDLVGAYFASHPPGTPAGAIDVEDASHPSMAPVPTRWNRTDEWYNYKPPAAGAAAAEDYSPRYDVHVLATLDETTYDEGDGPNGSNDGPTTTRSPGARTSTAATPGTRAAATRPSPSPTRSSVLTCSAESSRSPTSPAPAAARIACRRPAPQTSRRSRSTTTPRTRSSSTSRPTGGSSTSSATGA